MESLKRIEETDALWKLSPDSYAVIASQRKWKSWKHLRFISHKVQQAIVRGNGRLIISCPPRHGKLISEGTDVLTTNGWKKHGDLVEGDCVFSNLGNPIKVLKKGIRTKCDAVVSFSDGSKITCHLDHEWTVYNRKKRRIETVETRALLQIDFEKEKRCIYQLPKISALEFEEKELALDPYVLGLWLGDGNSKAARFSYQRSDHDYIKKIISLGFKVSAENIHKKTGVVTTAFGGGPNRAGPMTKAIKFIGVFKNKHIPEIYKRSSITQRLKLLAGLIDSDGHVDQKSRVRIVTARKILADDIFDIASSLGWHPYITQQAPCLSSSGIQGRKIIYTVGFQPDREIPVALERKKIKRFSVRRKIGITKVEKIETKKYGHCIQVDSNDGIYLVGRKLIPTHNSQLLSIWTSTWFLDLFPEKRIIIASYGDRLAKHFGRAVRNNLSLIEKESLSKDSKAASEFRTKEGGGLITAGVGGAITGHGMDLGLIDDPIRNMEDAQSSTIRENQVEWFNSTFYTRLEPGGTIIVILTRWHEDDLAGYLIKEHADNWEYINLPAIAEENDLLERSPGTALCPSRFDENALAVIKAGVGTRVWNALYQGRPSPMEGTMWKRAMWKRWEKLPETFDSLLQSWDTNVVEDGSSYCVGQIWGRVGANKYLIDQIRGKWGFSQLLEVFKSFSEKWPSANAKLVENKANGPALQDALKNSISGIIMIDPKGGKEVRAMACEPEIESGNVWLPADEVKHPWVKDFIEEAAVFPNGKNDDQVDTASQALVYLKTSNNFFSASNEKNTNNAQGGTKIGMIRKRMGNKL